MRLTRRSLFGLLAGALLAPWRRRAPLIAVDAETGVSMRLIQLWRETSANLQLAGADRIIAAKEPAG